jgi:REP element-mobilizing transposase RayT
MGWTPDERKSSYRRNLPHIQRDSRALFVTFRTYGQLVLPPEARDIVLATCQYEHQKRIELHAVVVMPTHVHMVFTPLLDENRQAYTLAEVLNAIKGVSAHRINRRLFRNGHVWQDESFDHVLRQNETIEGKVLYLMENPVAAGLVRSPLDYKWLWRQGVDDISTREGACATRPRE